jgi:hypothetical protein
MSDGISSDGRTERCACDGQPFEAWNPTNANVCPLCNGTFLRPLGTLKAERDSALARAEQAEAVLRYYADESIYNDDGAPTYENIGPPEGWLGEAFDPSVELDLGKAARAVLSSEGQEGTDGTDNDPWVVSNE